MKYNYVSKCEFENIENAKKILSQNVVLVAFTKVNGESREMVCTRDWNVIPKEFHPTQTNESFDINSELKMSKPIRKESEHSVSAFDLEKNAWRSFRLDAVTSSFVCTL